MVIEGIRLRRFGHLKRMRSDIITKKYTGKECRWQEEEQEAWGTKNG